MDEYRAASAPHPWPRVMINFDNEIVEMIEAAQPIAWFTGRPLDGAVVAAVSRVFAPGVGGTDGANRKQGSGPRETVGSPPQPQRVEIPPWRAAVTLALVGPDAGPAQRDGKGQRPGEQEALRPPTRPRADANEGEGNPSHTIAGLAIYSVPACSFAHACSTSH